MFKQWILPLTVMCFLSCSGPKDNLHNAGVVESSSTIVNGHDMDFASDLASPIAFVGTADDAGNNEVCTGVFISNELVLTAQHCIASNKDAMSLSFYNKDFKETGDVTSLEIVEVYKLNFSKISGLKRDDLGLIRYRGGLPAHAKAALLMDDRLLSVIGSFSRLPFKAVGFGKSTGADLEDRSLSTGIGTLRWKNMHSNQIDAKQATFRVDQHQNDGGVCSGDSGGPALIQDPKTKNYIVIGIASQIDFSREIKGVQIDDKCKNESIYSNMLFYTPLIKRIIAELPPMPARSSEYEDADDRIHYESLEK